MASPTPLEYSQGIEDLFNEQIIRPVWNDPRTDTDSESNIRLGYPFQVIRDSVLIKGRTDFSTGHAHKVYGRLTADEKVLLYCFINMKQHYFETLSTFRTFRKELRSVFEADLPARMIDLGCGPGTAALALADCLERPSLRYYGLDIAKPMLAKASTLIQAAVDKSLFGSETRFRPLSSWSELRRATDSIQKQVPINVLVNATYLFASDSLDVRELGDAIVALKRCSMVKRFVFTYSNTTAEIAGRKYQEFKRLVKSEIEWSSGVSKYAVPYRRRRRSPQISTASFVNDCISFK